MPCKENSIAGTVVLSFFGLCASVNTNINTLGHAHCAFWGSRTAHSEVCFDLPFCSALRIPWCGSDNKGIQMLVFYFGVPGRQASSSSNVSYATMFHSLALSVVGSLVQARCVWLLLLRRREYLLFFVIHLFCELKEMEQMDCICLLYTSPSPRD